MFGEPFVGFIYVLQAKRHLDTWAARQNGENNSASIQKNPNMIFLGIFVFCPLHFYTYIEQPQEGDLSIWDSPLAINNYHNYHAMAINGMAIAPMPNGS